MRNLLLPALVFVGCMLSMPVFAEEAEGSSVSSSAKQVEERVASVAQEYLTGVRDLQKQKIESYFASLSEQVRLLANDSENIEFVEDLELAFPRYEYQMSAILQQCCQPRNELMAYYQEVARTEQQLSSATLLPAIGVPKQADDNLIALQYRYLVQNTNPPQLKAEFDGPDEQAAYTRLHKRHHPRLHALVKDLGYSDLLLVNEQGIVLYSVAKNLDFATSLNMNHEPNSALLKLFGKLKAAPANEVVLQDFSFYPGAYGAWRAFAGIRLESDGLRLGILVVSIDDTVLDALITDKQRWPASIFRKTGETIVLGEDGLMRNTSRSLFETSKSFFAKLESNELVSEIKLELMRTLKRSAGLLAYDSGAVHAAFSGKDGFDMVQDPLGELVAVSYIPLEIPGLKWVLMNQVHETEFAMK